MILRRYLTWPVLALPATLLPGAAVALAGIAEHSYTYHFNRLAQLVWLNPGDGCEGDDKYCLELRKEDGRGFAGVDESLESINLPAERATTIIIARKSGDASWLVYDLDAETYLAEGATRAQALAVWRELGLAEPRFIGAHDVDRYLDETAASKRRRWTEQTMLMIVFRLPPLLLLVLLFGGLGLEFRRRHRRSGSRAWRVLAAVATVPAALAGIGILYSVGEAAVTRILVM
ncbi:MAG: hypothetical protein R3286_01630 [Gammaproteobacteria bacterium]|nr:hypothetical protein [Gammaproteobacteria bacterium]